MGLETYVIEKHLIDGVWTSLYEEAYSWDTVGNLLGSQYWEYVDGQKLAYIAEEYVYDTDNNVIESHHAFGQGTGADDWINVSRFTYIYENKNESNAGKFIGGMRIIGLLIGEKV